MKLNKGALGKLFSDRYANAFEQAAALADDHALLAVTLDQNFAPDTRPFPLGDTSRQPELARGRR